MTARAKVLLLVLISVLLLEAGAFGSWLWATRSKTEYSTQFNEAIFRSLPNGIYADAVVERLGQPLSRKTFEGTEVWYYSQPLGKSFSHRALVFDRKKHILIDRVSYEIVD
jgi:outer membrane protein assembly factor BamE (lipoprotein component of BamABCDE complex)